jgi:hypothetical protein
MARPFGWFTLPRAGLWTIIAGGARGGVGALAADRIPQFFVAFAAGGRYFLKK